MANLLPQEQRRIIEKDRWARMTSVGLILFFIIVVISAISLTPALLLSNSKSKNTQMQVALIQESSAIQEGSSVTEEIRDAQEKIALLLGEQTELILTDVLDALARATKNNVSVSSITFELVDNTSGVIGISGNSRTRDNLLTFANDLEESPYFTQVDLPISNLARSTNIRFTIKATVGEEL